MEASDLVGTPGQQTEAAVEEGQPSDTGTEQQEQRAAPDPGGASEGENPRLNKHHKPKPDKKAVVPSLSSAQLLYLCRWSLLASLVPMALAVIVFFAYRSDLPEQIATSFDEEKLPTGFSSPKKHVISMLFWSVFFQTAVTLAGVTLNPRMFHNWSFKVFSMGGCLDVEALFSAEHVQETATYVLRAFIWLGIAINSFILSIVWTTFAVNKAADEQGAAANPQVWLNLEDVPVSACCLKAYASTYFAVAVFIFLLGVGHHLYAGHSVHRHHHTLIDKSREMMQRRRKGQP